MAAANYVTKDQLIEVALSGIFLPCPNRLIADRSKTFQKHLTTKCYFVRYAD